jgi:hypothetical protein
MPFSTAARQKSHCRCWETVPSGVIVCLDGTSARVRAEVKDEWASGKHRRDPGKLGFYYSIHQPLCRAFTTPIYRALVWQKL